MNLAVKFASANASALKTDCYVVKLVGDRMDLMGLLAPLEVMLRGKTIFD